MPRSFARPFPILLVAGLGLHCGDDATSITTTSAGGTNTATTATATATATASTTATATDPSTTADTSTGTSRGTSTVTGATTTTETDTGTSGTTSSTTSTSTTGSTTETTASTSDTGVVEDADYAARYVPGGLDRIFIRKAEKVSGLCTHVGLVWPELEDTYEITTPEGWSVEYVLIAESLDGCLDFEVLAPVPVEAVAATGSVTWVDQGLCPATLDVDVTAEFLAGDLPWVPMKDQLTAEALSVEGCP